MTGIQIAITILGLVAIVAICDGYKKYLEHELVKYRALTEIKLSEQETKRIQALKDFYVRTECK